MKEIPYFDLGLVINNELIMLQGEVTFIGILIFISDDVPNRDLTTILENDCLVRIGTTHTHTMHRLEFT